MIGTVKCRKCSVLSSDEEQICSSCGEKLCVVEIEKSVLLRRANFVRGVFIAFSIVGGLWILASLFLTFFAIIFTNDSLYWLGLIGVALFAIIYWISLAFINAKEFHLRASARMNSVITHLEAEIANLKKILQRDDTLLIVSKKL